MIKGDLVDFRIAGILLMGKIVEFYDADVQVAKIRCEVNHTEHFIYQRTTELQPARFPEYYNEPNRKNQTAKA